MEDMLKFGKGSRMRDMLRDISMERTVGIYRMFVYMYFGRKIVGSIDHFHNNIRRIFTITNTIADFHQITI